ncbi:hypothetical protein Tco_0758549 [Tanacetum coccineum]
MLQEETLLDVLEHHDVITEFCSPSRCKQLSKEMSSKILPCGDGSCWKTFKPIASLISVERASILHQPDGVRSQRHHIVLFGELNGVLIALVDMFGVVFKSTDRIFASHEGQRKWITKQITQRKDRLRES